MGVLQGIAAGALLVMAMSVLAVAGSCVMSWASQPRAWQPAEAAAANYTADMVTAICIMTGLAVGLVAWWAALAGLHPSCTAARNKFSWLA